MRECESEIESVHMCVYKGHMGSECISRPVVMRCEASAGAWWSCPGRGGGGGVQGQLMTF